MSLPGIVTPSDEQLDTLSVKKSVKSHHGSANHSVYSKKTTNNASHTTKKKSEAEAKAAKEREERLVKLYDLWLQVKQDEREERNKYFKDRLNIQHALIQRQDVLSKKRQSKLNAKMHQIKEAKRLSKVAQSKHYSDFVKEELAKEKLLRSTIKSHSRVISSHQPVRVPIIISESPAGKSHDYSEMKSMSHPSADGTVAESMLLSDNFSELMNESVEVQLQMLLGTEALEFLKPTFREGAKKTLDPLIEKYRGIGAHQLWSILRGKSQKKLEKEDGKIPQVIKNAYRSFLRECLHADVPLVERSFCRNGDQIPESKISESHLIKDINFARHRLDLMFRVAHMNKDKTRLLFKNMESVDPKEGSVRPPRYNPDQIKEPKVVLLPLSSSKTESLVAEANKQEETTRQDKDNQPFLVGLDKISFLTENMAECKGEFSKRHKVAGYANDISTPKDEKRQHSIRGTISAPISSQEQRRMKAESVKSWQPLSVDALLEYKTRVDLVGPEDFLQGRPRTWKLKEAIVEETGSDTHYLQEGVFPPHPVLHNGVYRIWSIVSNGYLKRTTSTQVKCNGTDATAERHLTKVKARDLSTPTTKRFRFVLENPTTPSNEYVLTGGEEGTQVYLQDVPIRSTPPKDGESLFTPKYFYSTTLFNCSDVNGEKDLYIGSAADGNVTMVKGGADSYPNPFALFRLVSEI